MKASEFFELKDTLNKKAKEAGFVIGECFAKLNKFEFVLIEDTAKMKDFVKFLKANIDKKEIKNIKPNVMVKTFNVTVNFK